MEGRQGKRHVIGAHGGGMAAVASAGGGEQTVGAGRDGAAGAEQEVEWASLVAGASCGRREARRTFRTLQHSASSHGAWLAQLHVSCSMQWRENKAAESGMRHRGARKGGDSARSHLNCASASPGSGGWGVWLR